MDEYLAHMGEVSREIGKHATDANREEMASDLEQYRDKHVKGLKAWLEAKSKTMSAMIVGPAKFPTRSNSKKMDTEQKRLAEPLEGSKKALQRLRVKYDPAVRDRAPVSSDDANAVQRLQSNSQDE